MIKSLYTRVALTFVAAVVLGLIVAFFTTNYLFRERFEAEIQSSLETAATDFIHTANLSVSADPFADLAGLHWVGGYYISIYRADYPVRTLGAKDLKLSDIPNAFVERVLEGQVVSQASGGPSVQFVGYPVTLQGSRYAVFVQPTVKKPADNFGSLLKSILTTVLVIGCLFVLIAARYLVKPLKLMTKAAKRIAKGDFKVNLGWTHRNDEIGELARSFNQMTAELKQLESMRQDFISNVSHEIQSPLTSIAGFSKLLRYTDMPMDERNQYLTIIQTESERLSRLSDNMLKLASLESEHHPFHPVSFRLDEHIRRIIASQEPIWSEKRLVLDIALTPVMMKADQDQLSQVWMNVFHNAVKFTPAGGSIKVKLEATIDSVVVSFCDTGIGMSPDETERIFDRFYKADRSRERSLGGNGLGLSIVRKIVELHGGTITVQSERGKGTLFQISLPSLFTGKPETHST